MHTKNIASGIINNAKTFRTNATCKGIHWRDTEIMKIHFTLYLQYEKIRLFHAHIFNNCSALFYLLRSARSWMYKQRLMFGK